MSSPRPCEPDRPEEYEKDDVIPFISEGDSAYISGCVERVEGKHGQFAGMHCVRKNVIRKDYNDKSSVKRKLTREVQALYQARHTHVIHLVHTYFDNRNDEIRLCIVMDRAEVDLSEYLKVGGHQGSLPGLNWFGCLLLAIQHIHGIGIRHRDIKPCNILVTRNQVVLSDFGLSQLGLGTTMPTTNLARNTERSPEYCAPEVDEGRTRGRSADIFSLGAVFLKMWVVHFEASKLEALETVLRTRQSPSYAKNIDLVHNWIKSREERFGTATWQHKILMLCKAMLSSNRELRPSAEELDISDPKLTCSCANTIPITTESKLLRACESGAVDTVLQLLCNGADAHSLGAIHIAAERGFDNIVEIFLERGVNADCLNQVDQTPLHCASRSGRQNVVRLLLSHDSSVNAKDENGQTALHGAAAHGHEEIVRMLLRAGADAQAKNLSSNRPHILAKRRRHSRVLRILKDWEKNQAIETSGD